MTRYTNSQWILQKRPEGWLKRSDFEFRESPVRPIADGECLVRVSCDGVRPGCGEIRVCHDGWCLPEEPAFNEERRPYCDGINPGTGEGRCSEE